MDERQDCKGIGVRLAWFWSLARTSSLASLAVAVASCSLAVEFDRSQIAEGGLALADSSPGSQPDPSPKDAAVDAAAPPTDASSDSSVPDGSPASTCDLTTHAGCSAEELCCDGEAGPTCVATSPASQCSACGVACGADASQCSARSCGCGTGPACEGDTPLCDPSREECVGCLSDSDCGDQRCVDADQTCAECDPADDYGVVCEGDTPVCVATTPPRCAGCDHPLAPTCQAPMLCEDQSGACVECTEPSHCQAPTQCDLSTFACVGCGDGQTLDDEVCDDGNADDCGTCNAGCNAATGSTDSPCADGTGCTVNAVCAAICLFGTCAPTSGAGEDCDEDPDCLDGLTCVGAKCVLPAELAAPCDSDADCRGNLSCSGDDSSTDTCGGTSAPCTSAEQCVSAQCDASCA